MKKFLLFSIIENKGLIHLSPFNKKNNWMKIINNKKIDWNDPKSIYEWLKGIEFKLLTYGDIEFEIFAYHEKRTDIILVKKNKFYPTAMYNDSLNNVLPIERRNNIVDTNDYLWVYINVIKKAYENN